MYTPRKRQLRKKRYFLPNQHTFALFNGSNLKASKIAKIRLSLQEQNAKLYSVPLYLVPPKLGSGCPLIMIIYEKIDNLHTNIAEISLQIDCLGVSINKKWYSINLFKKEKRKNLSQKALALLLTKYNNNN